MSDRSKKSTVKGYENAKTVYYMCKTDYDFELPNCETFVYPDIKELREKRSCVEDCGIVEVEIRIVRIVQPSK